MADRDGMRALLAAHPELLGDDFDTLLLQYSAFLRSQGETESAGLIAGYREFLEDCRRLGVEAAFVKMDAYTLVGGLLRAQGREAKLAYLAAHPDLHGMTAHAALFQSIDRARAAGAADTVEFLTAHLLLIDGDTGTG